MSKFREFILFNHNNNNDGDFSGSEAALDVKGRLDFLKAYSRYLDKEYGMENSSNKAVSEKEVEEILAKISYKLPASQRKTLHFDTMEASVRQPLQTYKNWQFYTDRVQVDENAVIFNDGWTPPVPCAKYEITNGEHLKKVTLRVYISNAYNIKDDAKDCDKLPHDTATGRIIEVRSGVAELVKIQFYADGRVFACVGIPDRYHHTKNFLGRYNFDAWNELEIVFNGYGFDCSLNGKTTEGLLFTDQGIPDTLFFSGGMHAVDFWKVQPVQAVYKNQTQTDFFVAEPLRELREQSIGEVSLPYGIGGYKNRDKALILKKEFVCESTENVVLTVDTLDPGGEIRINGKTVCKVDGFMRCVEKIDAYIHKGNNLLEILVSPRAPEKLYCWHRCNDTYNAWLCGKVKIDFLSETYLTSLRVITEKVQPIVSAKLEIQLNREFYGKFRVFLKRTNPIMGNELEIFSGNLTGQTTFVSLNDLDVSIWDTDNPNLYAIRVQLEDENGTVFDDYVEEIGFRTIEQKNGDILLNGKKICLKGALIMQFLAPYQNILKSHTCPTDNEIVWQMQALKKMNANIARLHILGYGTNDVRFAQFCNRIGMTLIWTTRFIDSVESVKWSGEWKQKDGYLRQMREVLNNPSIIMWEGSNEFHAGRATHDALYDQFVSAIRSVDETRLICPCSHLYYGGGLYGNEGFYYQDDGLLNQDFEEAESSFGWKDPLVVRSAHTYDIMLGYGTDWGTFRKQGWKSEKSLFESKQHSYIVSEVAVIGRHDDSTEECKTYVKNDSYELPNEIGVFDEILDQKDWRISQAYQALSAQHIVKSLLSRNVDGIMWCCLSSGANDGSYLKPPIDFYGYAKYAFYVLQESFAQEICFNRSSAVVFGENTEIEPTLAQIDKKGNYLVKIAVKSMDGGFVDEYEYIHCSTENDLVSLPKWKPNITEDGYYLIEYDVQPLRKE